ncbi:MAG TPA: URC4/urg3 family protein [Geminicoccaceae bacterium]
MTAPAGDGIGEAVRALRTPEAVRERAKVVLAAAEAGLTPHFRVDPARLDDAARLVADVTRAAYPDLDVPFHSRWRHFAPDGRDRWAALASQLHHADPAEIARIRFDLVIPSVLLDAGAGAAWRYVEPASGAAFARSEGLALASLELFERGLLSAHPSRPLRADGAALRGLEVDALAAAFQAGPDNPLAGLDGRVRLLNRLGAAIELDPGRFGRPARLGHLYDHLRGLADGGRLPARTILIELLDAFAAIWPGRILLDGHNIGDVGRHPAVRTDDPTDGLVPFHKLSQWLAYSLIEPLEGAGLEVTGLDALTGLAEYRNGGLLIDTGVIVPKHDRVLEETHAGDGELVVEWRALTVALLDRLAGRVRPLLGLSAADLPLARVLQGGTWSAGRRIAREKRPDGGPPLRIESDGTLF